MHEWESQEKLIQEWELEEVEDCLKFVDLKYQRHEWDNIPIIVPRFIFYTNKYIKGLSKFCKAIDDAESTQSLRTDLDKKYKVRQKEISL